MRVAVYYNNRDVRIEDRPRPQLGPGELLMRIEASGICGSDVMEWYRVAKAPLVLGHEVAGVVEEVGPPPPDGVDDPSGGAVERFKPGDRIVATHHVPCMTCRYCLTDRHSVCDTLRTTHFDPGGFAEFVRVPAINVRFGTYHLPEHVGFEEASFVEPLACAVRAQRIAGVQPGDTVAVLGSGISGMLHIQLARRVFGATRVIATDVDPYRLKLALNFGADVVLDAASNVPGLLHAAANGHGADRVIVCAAALPAVKQAFECVDRGGTIMFFALAPPGVEFPLALWDVWKDGITIMNSYAGPPADMEVALDLIAHRRVDVANMVTHRLGLGEIADGFRMVEEARESLKIVVEPQR